MNKLKLSKYIEVIFHNQEYILFNKINGSILIFDNDQIEIIESNYWIKVKSDIELKILKENDFFIYDQDVQIMIKEELIKKNILNNVSITISTTELCNMNCKYCYQHDWKKDEKIDKRKYMKIILDYIKVVFTKVLDSDLTLKIHYIGGEPLLENDFILELNKKIENLCDESKKNVNILYSIDTNSLLLNEGFIKSFSNLLITTTLSCESDHNNLRNNTYEIVYDKIKQLSRIFDGEKYKLNIRYNVHSDNIDSFKDFILTLNDLNVKCSIDIQNIYNSVGTEFYNTLSDYEFEEIFLEKFLPILIENKYNPRILPAYGISLNCDRVNILNCKFYSNGEKVLCDAIGKSKNFILKNLQETMSNDLNDIPYMCIRCYDFPYCGGVKPCDIKECNGNYEFKEIARSRIKRYVGCL